MSGSRTPLLSSERPFPGLRPFAYEDHDYFFGREDQIFSLYRLIDRTRFVAVVGSSGSGKSSLVRAGLLPLLDRETKGERGRNWLRVEMHPGDAPLRNLAAALARLAQDEDDAVASARRERVAYQLRYASLEHALAEAVPLGERALLILVDQFEELFRYAGAGAGQKRELRDEARSREDAVRFVQLLLEASRSHDAKITVVLTMRSDFIGECARFQDLPEAVSASQYLVPSLTRDQREEVIRKPIDKAGATIEPILVERLLNDSGNDLDQLPVLQHCLLRIWEEAGRRTAAENAENSAVEVKQDAEHLAGRELTVADYEAVGRMNGAMSKHADDICKKGLPGHEWEIERTFRALSELDMEGRAIRRALPFDALLAETGADKEKLRDVLDAFRADDCSFLTPAKSAEQSLAGETRIDIGHEALLRRWEKLTGEPGATEDRNDKRSIGWLREERNDARRYQALLSIAENDPKGDATLDPGLVEEYSDWWTKLRPTEAWAKRYGGERGGIEPDGFTRVDQLLQRSRDRAARLQQALRQRDNALKAIRVASVAALVVLLFVGLAIWMGHRSQHAKEILALKSATQFVNQVLQSRNAGDITINGAKDLLDAANNMIASEVGDVSKNEESAGLLINLKVIEFDVYYAAGEMKRALSVGKEAAEAAEKLAAEDPYDPDLQLLLYGTVFRLGDVNALPDPQYALEQFHRAQGIIQKLIAKSPNDPDLQTKLLFIDNKIGETLQLQKKWPQALAEFNAALDIATALVAKNAGNVDWQLMRATTLDKIGYALASQPQPDYQGALDKYDAAIAIQEKLAHDLGSNDVVQSNLATSYLGKADVLTIQGNSAEAFKNFDEGIEIQEALVGKDSNNAIWLEYLARDFHHYGDALKKSDDGPAALVQFQKELSIRQQLAAKDPNNPIWKKGLHSTQKRIADLTKTLSGSGEASP